MFTTLFHFTGFTPFDEIREAGVLLPNSFGGRWDGPTGGMFDGPWRPPRVLWLTPIGDNVLWPSVTRGTRITVRVPFTSVHPWAVWARRYGADDHAIWAKDQRTKLHVGPKQGERAEWISERPVPRSRWVAAYDCETGKRVPL